MNEELKGILELSQTANYIIVSLISLYFYDIILRLPTEVQLLWRLALYRLHTLWRLKKGQTVLLVTCFFVVVLVTCIVAIMSVISEKKSVIFIKNVGVCVERTPKRSFVGSFIAVLILDVVGLALFITNGLHRPRRSTDNFAKILYRDGLQLFLSLLALRLMALVVLTLAPIQLQNLGAVTSVICVSIVCFRSYLNFVELEPSLNGSNVPLTLNPQ
ncbi:hypothetical protein PNOK_0645200 [Pyrrhoderma noxium]|uniref:DUF6533 domain-containing protein n=1 Tax=Pyrrhoderma noxium TaxID=2282107 RepID=A0A286UEE4_9AGAM|nr:hypothetical protein PNOK_0645200 [Pyrrhoderma noxium]